MSKLIFFIGPSGSGKSTVCSQLEKDHSNFRREKLDNYEKDNDSSLGIRRIEELEKSQDTNIYLIDVGAFFQAHIPNQFWLSRKDKIITIYNEPEVCHKVHKNRKTLKKRASYDEHCKKEFNEKRQKLNNLSNFKIITNEKVEDSVKKAHNFIEKILNN